MTVRPGLTVPLIDRDGRISREWVDYITRAVASIELLDTDIAATAEENRSKINEIITSLKTAGIMK